MDDVGYDSAAAIWTDRLEENVQAIESAFDVALEILYRHYRNKIAAPPSLIKIHFTIKTFNVLNKLESTMIFDFLIYFRRLVYLIIFSFEILGQERLFTKKF